MTVLTDLVYGDQFLFVAQVVAIDGAGFHVNLYGPGSVQAASAVIGADGTMAGELAASPAVTLVTVVTGFAPVAVGDVLASVKTGETLVARWAEISTSGTSVWSDRPDAATTYPAAGWTVIGHVDL